MYSELSLPTDLLAEKHRLLQKSSALGVSSATASLYEYLKHNFPGSPLRVLEAGSSSGILCLMLKLSQANWELTGLEIQEELHHLAIANAEALKLQLCFVNGDLRCYDDPEGFDLIIANPPWQKLGSGLISPDMSKAISRTELCCTMDDVLAFCGRNLGIGKQAVLIYPSSRKEELLQLASNYGFGLKTAVVADTNTLIYHLVKGHQV